tara:strand:- start:1304 stop:1507 length:204 start_codon:yes stop_codon:yes gene_type:complete
MNKLIDQLIIEFKKLKRVRGNLFENFLTFVHLCLTDKKDDKYKVKVNEILEYIVINKQSIKLKLIQN